MSQMETIGQRTIGTVKWHLIPFLFVLYIINFIDRVNLGYAALTMNKELAISSAARWRRSGSIYNRRRPIDGRRIVGSRIIVSVGPIGVAVVVPIGSIPVVPPVSMVPVVVSGKGGRRHE